jgi:hypothetical protein
MPAQAGIQVRPFRPGTKSWIPAIAGMTTLRKRAE